MRVLVKFYSSYREVAGTSEIFLEMPEGSSLESLVHRVKEMFPKLKLQTDEIIVSLNKKTEMMGTALKEGDEVSFLPPVTGG